MKTIGKKGMKDKNSRKADKTEKRDLLKYSPVADRERDAMRKMGGSMSEKKMGASRPDLSKTKKIKDNKTKMGASMMEKKGASMSGENYDAKQAYNKNLSASARLHYLENNRADKKAKGGSHRSPIMTHMKNI